MSSDTETSVDQIIQAGEKMFAAADDLLAGSELDEQHSDINTDQSLEDDGKRAALSIINPPEYCKVVKAMCRGTVNVKCEDNLLRQCVCPEPASTCSRHRLKGTHEPGWYKKVIPGPTSTQRQPIGHSETYVSFAQMQRVESLERKSASRTAYVTQQDEDGRSAASDYSFSSASRRTEVQHNTARQQRRSSHGARSPRRTRSSRSSKRTSVRSMGARLKEPPVYPSEVTQGQDSHRSSRSSRRKSVRSEVQHYPQSTRYPSPSSEHSRRTSQHGRPYSQGGQRGSHSPESVSRRTAPSERSATLDEDWAPPKRKKPLTVLVFPDGGYYVSRNHHKIGTAVVERKAKVAGTFPDQEAVAAWEKSYLEQNKDASSESDVSYHGSPPRQGRSRRSSRAHRAPSSNRPTRTSKSPQRRTQVSPHPTPRGIDINQTDPSTGKIDDIYGAHIDSTEMEEMTLPPGLESKDSQELFDLAPDIMSLPGKSACFTSEVDSGFSEADQTASMVDALRMALGKDGIERVGRRDTQWDKATRHALSQIKDETSLRECTIKLKKCRKSVLDRFTRAVTLFLLRRRYSHPEITLYLEKGGLPQIIRKTFDLYTQLLDTILYEQQRTNVYEHGFAGALVLHHSEELLDVRGYAVTKRDMTLRAYIYLRNSEKHDFKSHKIQSYLWDVLEEYRFSGGLSGGRSEDHSSRTSSTASALAAVKPPHKCSHCNSNRLHPLYSPRIAVDKSACPLRLVSTSKARKIRSALLTAFDKDSSMKSISQSLIQEYIQLEEDGKLP